MIKWWLSYHADHGIRDDPCDHEVVIVLMTLFWCHFGVRMGGFCKHYGVILSSKIVLEAPWTLHSSQTSISTVRLRPFWRILEVAWGGFWRYFSIFFGYRFCNRLASAFKMIFHWFSYPPDKQKWANCRGRPAKIKLSYCLLSNVFWNWFWKDFGFGMEAFLSSN